MADNGGVHIGPWKETDMLSGDLGGDQEVIHACDWMYNFLVSTEHVCFLPWTNMDSTIVHHSPFVSYPY